MNDAFSRTVRRRRLYRHGVKRLLIAALDHPISDGPIVTGRFDNLLGQICPNGADAVVLHRGILRHIDTRWFNTTSLVVHLSAGTRHASDPDDKYLVTSVPQAIRLGADAVSVHVNLGSQSEARQIRDLAAVSTACDRWNMPLLAMIYPRGPQVANPRDPDLVAHAVTLAVELGADLVKTVFPDCVQAFAQICHDSPIPVLVAGGKAREDADLLSSVDQALTAGAGGVAIGRNIFQAADPGATTAKLADRVHGRFERVTQVSKPWTPQTRPDR